jgi:hypothetical protein
MWQRKWTHKTGWVGEGKNAYIIAMTDGLTINLKTSLNYWVEENDMVKMTRLEVISFLLFDKQNF